MNPWIVIGLCFSFASGFSFAFAVDPTPTPSLVPNPSPSVSVSATTTISASPKASVTVTPTPMPNYVLTLGKGMVEFSAIGNPSALRIHGKGGSPKGSLALQEGYLSGAVSFDLDSFDTGIELRNKHMKEKYLEVAKDATAVLVVQKQLFPGALYLDHGRITEVPLQGSLKLHGVEKPVFATASVTREDARLEVKVDFDILLSDYNIITPGFAGITMAQTVKVHVETQTEIKKKDLEKTVEYTY